MTPAYALPLVLAALLVGCSKSHEPAPTTTAPIPAASASAPTTPASAPSQPDHPPELPTGAGVTSFGAPGEECHTTRTSMAEYLQRANVTLAAREGAIAAAWLVQVPGKPAAQIAFGGFDGEGKALARVRGIGASRDHAPRLFATGSEWTATWFDQDGLAWTRPRWEPLPPPLLEHVRAIGADLAADVGLAATLDGQLATVAPFGVDRAQLGVFVFAPTQADAPAIRAVGVTRSARRPRRPAIAVKSQGHYVAWLDDDRRLVASVFDQSGRESDVSTIAPSVTTKEPRLAIVPTPSGLTVLWEDEGTILTRSLDDSARPSSPIFRVGQGHASTLVAAAEGSLAAWISAAAGSEGKLVVARLSGSGAPAPRGLRLSEAPARGGPVLAMSESRLAVGWTEPMGPAVSSMRAVLAVLDSPCVPPE